MTDREDEADPATVQPSAPGLNDRGVRRYRSFRFEFDSRALFLGETMPDGLSEEGVAEWRETHAQRVNALKAEYGSYRFEQKLADFLAFGPKPFSIIGHHNQLFEQVRTAFVSGGYYAALTGACALGERILNHLILDLRDHYRATPEYKAVWRKDSFDRWALVIDTLAAWKVLLPPVVEAFRKLEVLRNRSIHFNLETAGQLRADALKAIGHLQAIISGQFAAMGLQPWFIEGVLGAGFIKKAWEDDPFVRHYYLPGNVCVGPFHDIAPRAGGWQFFDHPNYRAYGIEELTDGQFKDLFNSRPIDALARFPDDVASAEASPAHEPGTDDRADAGGEQDAEAIPTRGRRI